MKETPTPKFDPKAIQGIVDRINGTNAVFDADQHQTWFAAQKKLKDHPFFKVFCEDPFYPVASIPNFELTPAKALLLEQNFNLFAGQRGKTDRRMNMIGMAHQTNTFHGNKLVLVILGEDYECSDGRRTRTLLLNGGNTIGASLKFGITLKHNTLMVFYCPTVKSAAHAYACIDPKESTRTATEINKGVLAGRADRDVWTSEGKLQPKIYHDCKTAAMVAEFGPSYRGKKLTETEKENILDTKYINDAYWLAEFIFADRKTPKYMKTVVGVLGVMLYTRHVWGDLCEDFWNDVKLGLRTTPNNRMNPAGKTMTPQHAVVHYLTTPTVREDEASMFEKVMTAANAWAKGKPTFNFKGNRTKKDEQTGERKKSWDREPIELTYFHPHPKCLPTDEELDA